VAVFRIENNVGVDGHRAGYAVGGSMRQIAAGAEAGAGDDLIPTCRLGQRNLFNDKNNSRRSNLPRSR
jgi:hypothetical protein